MCVDISNLKLLPQGVLVVWEWEWEDNNSSESDESTVGENVESIEQFNPNLPSDSESSEDSSTVVPSQMHTVTFKCVGSTYDADAQECLSKASKILRDGGTAEMKMAQEPNNQYNTRAVAFLCKINDKWQRVGYVVKECLEYVHKAMSEGHILSVKLAWAKYLVCWSRSGPGFYAGVNVTLQGVWHSDVVRSQSTR